MNGKKEMMSDNIKCAIELCDHDAEIEAVRGDQTLWLCIPHHKLFIPLKETAHIIHESHNHNYDIDISNFADFIESRSYLTILVHDKQQWSRATTWDIIQLFNAFREHTLPKATKETR